MLLPNLGLSTARSDNEKLEQATHEWLREALFFIGASWYSNRKEFIAVYEVSGKLKLRWLFNHNKIKVVIEQSDRRQNWLGAYSIGNSDPFVLGCQRADDTRFVEAIVRSYLPQIEIVQCGVCEARFGNTLYEVGWRCDDCTNDFPLTAMHRAGFVYIFGSADTGYYKIGCGDSPQSRMKDYQRANLPFPVEMIHTIPVDDKRKAEAELHRLYRTSRTNGEWFKLSTTDLSRLTNLKKYVAGHWFEGVIR